MPKMHICGVFVLNSETLLTKEINNVQNTALCRQAVD